MGSDGAQKGNLKRCSERGQIISCLPSINSAQAKMESANDHIDAFKGELERAASLATHPLDVETAAAGAWGFCKQDRGGSA